MRSLGVRQGDRVGTFCWNHGRHLHAYYGIPASGAVLHTLNIRLHPDELAYIVNHADDSVLIVDKVLWPHAGVMLVHSLPRTGVGKYQKNVLRERYRDYFGTITRSGGEV
jgi:acyl-CoA synthetase (AMP-forming)/AMP-acid ligase II